MTVHDGFTERLKLYETAMALPQPAEHDFVMIPPPPSEQRVNLRVIADRQLRTHLLSVGMAESIQAARGRSKIPSIIRIRPSLDARERTRSATVRPTVEDLREVVDRVLAIESELRTRVMGEIDARVARLRADIARLPADRLERAVDDLRTLLSARADLAGTLRKQALEQVSADPAFAPGQFARLISDQLGPEIAVPQPQPAKSTQKTIAKPVPAGPKVYAEPRIAGKKIDPRREAYRAEWDAKLLPLLSSEWQSSFSLAAKARAKNRVVIERLRDMLLRGLVHRRIVKVTSRASRSKRNKRSSGIIEAQFKLRST